MVELDPARLGIQPVKKYNENHDASNGQFSSGGGSGGGGKGKGPSGSNKHGIANARIKPGVMVTHGQRDVLITGRDGDKLKGLYIEGKSDSAKLMDVNPNSVTSIFHSESAESFIAENLDYASGAELDALKGVKVDFDEEGTDSEGGEDW